MISMSRYGCAPKPMPGITEIVVDDAQGAITHPVRIVIIREAEGVITIQPPVIWRGPRAFVGFKYFHMPKHDMAISFWRKYHVSCLTIVFGHTENRMELRHLRYFVAVAGEENVDARRAEAARLATRLELSRIRDLEDGIGFRNCLNCSAARQLRLTASRENFLAPEARAVLQHAEDAVAGARAAAGGTQGEIRVSVSAPSLTVQISAADVARVSRRVSGASRACLLHDLSSEGILALTGRKQTGSYAPYRAGSSEKMPRGLSFIELARYATCVAMSLRNIRWRWSRALTLAQNRARAAFIEHARARIILISHNEIGKFSKPPPSG